MGMQFDPAGAFQELAMQRPVDEAQRTVIPVIEVGREFPFETLLREEGRAHALLDAATHRVPASALRSLDTISRRWLEKWDNAHLGEIDAIAGRLDRPGAYFLSVNYEWGCTCQVAPSSEKRTPRLIRVLDWRTPGLGRNILAAKVAGRAGTFLTMTWPGYTGVLQGLAKGRFTAALNQAPMRKAVGVYALDWAANRARVWRMPHPTPAHLLREVFETAQSYADARRMLTERPIASPAIYSIAGIQPHETAVIERAETEAVVHEGRNVAANHWQASGWHGRARGIDSAGRAAMMHRIANRLEPSFDWLEPPILNGRTRLAMVSDAAEGRLVAQGYEEMQAATEPLELAL